jgi:hypothetical protein
MTELIASIVDWGELGSTVVASVIAALGVTAAFSVSIFGAAQFQERRRQGESIEAFGAAALSVAGLLFCAAAITFGLIVMLS